MINYCSDWFYHLGFILILINQYHLIDSTIDSTHQVFQVNVGQDVTLSCLFDPSKLEQIAFMRQMTGDILSVGNELFVDVDLTQTKKEHFQLKQISSNRLDLKILSIEEHHSDLYTCMFNDQKLFSYSIQVFVPPRFIGYYPLEGTISSPSGSTLNMFCDVLAIPSVNITWRFTNQTKYSTILHDGKDLQLNSIKTSDSGLYQCIASNDHHTSISRSFFLNVQYSPQISILNKKIRYSKMDFVDIRCHVCSNPPVDQFQWFRNGKEIVEKNIFIRKDFLNENCFQLILRISNLTENQFGSYECRSSNHLGQKSETIFLRQMIKYRKAKENPQMNRPVLSNQIFENKRLNLTTKSTNSSRKFFSTSSIFFFNFLFCIFRWI